MTKAEYRIISANMDEIKKGEDTINSLGNCGWRVISTVVCVVCSTPNIVWTMESVPRDPSTGGR